MLGKTAGGLYWMFRYLERGENTARLVDAGFRIALTYGQTDEQDWESVLETAGVTALYHEQHDSVDRQKVLDFLLTSRSNPSSVWSCFHAARNNGRLVRTALTRETWEAVNESWITLNEWLSKPVAVTELPELLAAIRRQNALVRGSLHGTMLRNDAYDFCRLGTFIERADNTARILDVKYYVLLPSRVQVGSSFDNVQWESILRSVSGQRAFRWLNGTVISARKISDFMIFDERMPRSLVFCACEATETLESLAETYQMELGSLHMGRARNTALHANSIDKVFDDGLHEFLAAFRIENEAMATRIEQDFRFQ